MGTPAASMAYAETTFANWPADEEEASPKDRYRSRWPRPAPCPRCARAREESIPVCASDLEHRDAVHVVVRHIREGRSGPSGPARCREEERRSPEHEGLPAWRPPGRTGSPARRLRRFGSVRAGGQFFPRALRRQEDGHGPEGGAEQLPVGLRQHARLDSRAGEHAAAAMAVSGSETTRRRAAPASGCTQGGRLRDLAGDEAEVQHLGHGDGLETQGHEVDDRRRRRDVVAAPESTPPTTPKPMPEARGERAMKDQSRRRSRCCWRTATSMAASKSCGRGGGPRPRSLEPSTVPQATQAATGQCLPTLLPQLPPAQDAEQVDGDVRDDGDQHRGLHVDEQRHERRRNRGKPKPMVPCARPPTTAMATIAAGSDGREEERRQGRGSCRKSGVVTARERRNFTPSRTRVMPSQAAAKTTGTTRIHGRRRQGLRRRAAPPRRRSAGWPPQAGSTRCPPRAAVTVLPTRMAPAVATAVPSRARLLPAADSRPPVGRRAGKPSRTSVELARSAW